MRLAPNAAVGLLCAFAIAASAQTNGSLPPKHVQLAVPLVGTAASEAARAGARVTALNAVVDMPRNFSPIRQWPVLLVCAPSGASAVAAARSYTNVALAEGWVVIAVDGPKVGVEQDNNVFAWAMISSLLYELRRSWPNSKQWPFACAGFSGGSKRAAMVAAEMVRRGDRVVGVFMGGCNEDRATLGYNLSNPGPGFLRVPMFLSSGKRDAVAGPAAAQKVKESMEQTGFSKIRFETYDDQHRLDTNQVRLALDWFLQRPQTPAGLRVRAKQ